MKRLIKNLLIGVGIASIGFTAYVLWGDYTKKTEQEKESSEAKKRAEFIERRRAYVRKKSAIGVTEDGGGFSEADSSAYESDCS